MKLSKLRNPRVQGTLRHLLTSLGPLVAANGWTTDVYWQIGVGVVMSAIGFWASVTAPEKKEWV